MKHISYLNFILQKWGLLRLVTALNSIQGVTCDSWVCDTGFFP